jgi:hypothetical protein
MLENIGEMIKFEENGNEFIGKIIDDFSIMDNKFINISIFYYHEKAEGNWNIYNQFSTSKTSINISDVQEFFNCESQIFEIKYPEYFI